MKILVIEDDPIVLALASKTLGDEFATECIQAKTGEEALGALARAESTGLDLILSDIELPDLNGIELYGQVKTNRHWDSVPIIFMTAHDDLDYVQSAFATGAIDFIVKPIVPNELIARVRKALSLNKDVTAVVKERRDYARSTGYAPTWISADAEERRYLSPLVEDYSASGLRLLLDAKNEIADDRVVVLFSIPGRKDLLELKGRVVRREKNEQGQTEIAVHFEHISPEAREAIDLRIRSQHPPGTGEG